MLHCTLTSQLRLSLIIIIYIERSLIIIIIYIEIYRYLDICIYSLQIAFDFLQTALFQVLISKVLVQGLSNISCFLCGTLFQSRFVFHTHIF